ncbi:xylulokinase [Muricomes intestini]|uniref:Xylulose kinase n=2 Tax=Muricomes intestini TaxID=1796634 RepID=A0A4R3KHG9_9FIRM|nr:xylulokinase [Muricomes intestini]TCS82681.1 xylulokinase [Muricomes intestini]HAX51557.1 xylulokinase [Lachnospiraceae bacterium]
MQYYIGIDLGTSSVKSLLMREDGEIIDTAQEGYDIIKPDQQYAQQDMNLLCRAAERTIQAILKKHPGTRDNIRGVGYSGQMHGLVMIDKDGNLIRDAIIWADQRSGEEIRDIYSVIPEEEYKKVVLNSLSTGFLISSLMWVKKHEPEVYAKIFKVMLPKDYLRYKMCGELGTDMSDASSAVIFDTKNRQWAWEFIDRLGLEREFFVPCHEAYEIAGEVTAGCEKNTGLWEGTKLVYGGGDSLMQGIGNGIISPGTLSANIGTSSQLSCALPEPLYDSRYRTNTFCHVREDRWMLMGANLSGGVALKWLMRNVLDMQSYDEMTALAEKVPAGSRDLLFLPYLSGERTPYNDPDAKGIYLGLTLKHARAEMIRSTMEGIIFGLRNSLEIFQDMGIEFQRIFASGGGARGHLFRQIQADMFGKEIYTSVGKEQACVGAAITAAVGTGGYASYEEACGCVVRLSEDVVIPDAENQKIYEERYAVYKELYPRNKDLFGCRNHCEGL